MQTVPKNQKQQVYSKSPLPFVGQKRNFIKQFREVIDVNIPNSGHGWTIIDVFGGSGLLAHNAKFLKPNAKVIYNDFDNFRERIENICDTNRLRSLLFNIVRDTPKNKALNKHEKSKVINCIENFDGYIDVVTLNSWLGFSGSDTKEISILLSSNIYNSVKKNPIDLCNGYLSDLDITNDSYENLMINYQNNSKTLFILDPPYLSTDQSSYNLKRYFNMVSFLKMMLYIRPPYMLFSSTRSEILDYIEYTKEYDIETRQRIGDYKKESIYSRVNSNGEYTDHMIYNF